jgi:hypothetical protein
MISARNEPLRGKKKLTGTYCPDGHLAMVDTVFSAGDRRDKPV